MAIYLCFKEDSYGYCDKSNVVGYILSRDPTVPIEREATLKYLLKESCLGLQNWKRVGKKMVILNRAMLLLLIVNIVRPVVFLRSVLQALMFGTESPLTNFFKNRN